MTIESHVCSLDLSKRLKHLGVKQNSLYYWWNWHNHPIIRDAYYAPEISGQIPYSAFLASELGEMLPEYIDFNHKTYWLTSDHDLNVYYQNKHIHEISEFWAHDIYKEYTEANSRALMLVHLIETEIVKV